MNGYDLSRQFFDWSFENPEKVSPSHIALYFWCIETANRFGWKEKFGLGTLEAKEAIGIKSYNTYIKTLHDLIEWGFIRLIQKSKNQHTANIIAISNFDKASDKALDKALIKHVIKQDESTSESIDSIIKLINNKQVTSKQVNLLQDSINKFLGKENSSEIIDEIYSLYPSVCPIRKASNSKTAKKNKQQIDALLQTFSADVLKNKIKQYVDNCIRSRVYMKNFTTFLNNIPDDISQDEIIPRDIYDKPEPYRAKAVINPDGSIQF